MRIAPVESPRVLEFLDDLFKGSPFFSKEWMMQSHKLRGPPHQEVTAWPVRQGTWRLRLIRLEQGIGPLLFLCSRLILVAFLFAIFYLRLFGALGKVLDQQNVPTNKLGRFTSRDYSHFALFPHHRARSARESPPLPDGRDQK